MTLREADIQPLAFDVHEILNKGSAKQPVKIILRHRGNSNHLKATFYLYMDGRTMKKKFTLRHDEKAEVEIKPYHKLTKIGIVLSNLDPDLTSEYTIEIQPLK